VRHYSLIINGLRFLSAIQRRASWHISSCIHPIMSRFFARLPGLRHLVVGLFFLVLAFASRAGQVVCAVCGKPIEGEYRGIVDQITGETNAVCMDCAKLDRCFACGMPVKDNPTHLVDGRVLCARDAADVVTSEDAAKDICQNTHDDIDRLFSRFLTFPSDNVEVSIVDKFHLENLFHAPGFHADGSTVYGATASNPLPGGKFLHTIDILSFLGKSRLMAVCAHEYTHTWLNENLTPARNSSLDRNTIEGFCELIAYKYMESRHDTQQMEIIKHNNYTEGQVEVLLAAEARYGFETLVEWMKAGEDTRLDMANLDRVRDMHGGDYTPVQPPSVVWAVVTPPPPTAVPNTLVLKGISGARNDRFALINNATFETMEKGPVRVGATNVMIRCLEIHDDSVVIQVEGSTQKKQLFLKPQ
jgi:Protein DA1